MVDKYGYIQYFTNLLSKNITLTGGTKRHDTAYRLQDLIHLDLNLANAVSILLIF